jgi:hypothetical protein
MFKGVTFYVAGWEGPFPVVYEMVRLAFPSFYHMFQESIPQHAIRELSG